MSRKVRHSCLQGMMGDSRDCVWEFTQENLHCLCQTSKDVDISLRPSRTEVQNLLPCEDQSGKERRKSVFKKCLHFLLMFLNILIYFIVYYTCKFICMYIYYTCTIIHTSIILILFNINNIFIICIIRCLSIKKHYLLLFILIYKIYCKRCYIVLLLLLYLKILRLCRIN